MKKKLFVALFVLGFMSISVLSFAEIVYKTPRGKRYHKKECKLIRKKEKLVEIDKEAAEEKGLKPCRVCFKKELKESKKKEVIANKEESNESSEKELDVEVVESQ